MNFGLNSTSARHMNPSRIMKKCLTLALALIAFASPLGIRLFAAEREGIEWCDLWISHANETNQPRVLLIGDSITRGYYGEVEKRLAGKAYVARLATSAFLTDPMLSQQITLVLDNMKFDVVHFNNGMHGWQHSETEYREAFPAFVSTIQKHAPQARLIWANTTPIRENSKHPTRGPQQASNDRVAQRNAIAREFLAAQKIPINDLNALMANKPELHSDDVHFNRDGITLQGEQVAREIEKLLPKR